MRHYSHTDFRYQGFGVINFYVFQSTFLKSLRDMPQWEVLGGQCSKCGHIGWLEKRTVIARTGNHYLVNVRRKLRCLPCGYRGENDVLIGHLGRNI